MAPSPTQTYAIEAVDLAAASDELLERLNSFGNQMSQERVPEDPPTSLAVLASRVRNRPSMMWIQDWLARTADGDVIARGYVARWDADTNQHLREASIEVLPAYRRQGIAKSLLWRIAEGAGDREDLVIGFWSSDRIPAAAAFLRRVGAKPTLTTYMNQLDVSRLDRALVRQWASIDPAGYHLERIGGDVSNALLSNVIVAYDTMNTAPRSSAMDDWHTTPEQIREWDRTRKAAGRERRLTLAIHAATGETAGYTELNYDAKVPHVIWQQGTAVVPQHRGRGIGKWVKAVNLEWAIRDWPKAELVRTGNADSNAPMLAINTRLGFRRAWANTIWEIGIADARRYLEGTPA